MKNYFCHFESELGTIGLAWTENGVSCLQLPEESSQKTLAVLQARIGEARLIEPDAEVAKLVKLLQLHLSGQSQDFRFVQLDLHKCSEFSQKVFAATRRIPPACLTTYARIASEIEAPSAARAVGRALGSNPVPILIPCHRVISTSGKLTGFSAYGACDTKLKLLSLEKTPGIDSLASPSQISLSGSLIS